MRFSQEFIERLLESTDIVELIGQYTPLKRSGHNLMGLCPFPDHREKSPSFSVSETKRVYHCFGCKRGGNAFRFMQDYMGYTFVESVEVLANRAGISLPEPEDRPSSGTDNRKLLLKLNKVAGLFYHRNLMDAPPDHPARQYIETRRLSPETVEKFRLGYAPEAWESLVVHLQRAKAPVNLAESVGLIKKRTSGRTGFYDVLRDRLVFPIISPTGDVLGFGGRTLGDGTPKYLNSSDSSVFHKGKVLYGLNESARYLRSEDFVVVVEGYMDFLGLYQAGIVNVVATLGTALTPDHAKLLKRYTHNVVVLFDGDSAGQDAMERSLPVLLAEGLYAKALTLPDELDPDEYVLERGADELKKALKNAPDLFVTQIERLVKRLGTRPADKVRIMDEIAPILKAIPDPRLVDLYLQELTKWLSVDRAWILKSLGPLPNRAPAAVAKSTRGINKLDDSMPNEELIVLNLILAQEQLLLDFIELKGWEHFVSPLSRELAQIAVDRYGQNSKDFDKLTAYLSSRVEEPGLLTKHLDERQFQLDEEKGRQLLRDCLEKSRSRALKAQARSVLQSMTSADDPVKLEQFVNIIKSRRKSDREA